MLELKSIKKDYVTSSETVHALRGVDIIFRDKEFVSVLGPSGCGKTTLLNIVGGLDHYTDGDLVIGGRSTRFFKDRDWDVYRNHRVGFIFQSYNLIPHQTILGNVELALTISGVGKKERVARAKLALDRVGLKGQYNKKPNQLSGGQCQRVAIARALVNDPEILLADEPTGALDTVTSVQIMELIREIADERLVIMVTHNPELAEQYSTRIIRLLDGNVESDSNPVTEEEYAEELAKLGSSSKLDIRPLTSEMKKAESVSEERRSGVNPIRKDSGNEKAGKTKVKKKEKAKMSIFTAFRLSAKNLLSKKGRTSVVGIAGSIGIIGIAMVLAFSSGIKGYVKSMQDDMLSGNPIEITEMALDMNAITSMMSMQEKEDFVKKEPGKVYINSLIEYIVKTSDKLGSVFTKNDISRYYFDYIKAMPKEYYSAMLFDYGIDMSNNIYTVFNDRGEERKISISALTNIYTSMLSSTDYKEYVSSITQIVPSFAQAPNNKEYIKSQYEVIGEIADEYDEIMLVLNGDQELSDLLLARMGYYSSEEFFKIIDMVSSDEENYKPDGYREYFTHEELLGKTFTYYLNDQVYEKSSLQGSMLPPFSYYYDAKDIATDGVELKVTGILYANENTTYGCLSSGIYYTEALTNYVLENNRDSEIVEYMKSLAEQPDGKAEIGCGYMPTNINGVQTAVPTGIYYSYSYTTYEGEKVSDIGFVGAQKDMRESLTGLAEMMGGAAGGGSSSGGSSGGSAGGAVGGGNMISLLSSLQSMSLTLRHVGGADIANEIFIYPVTFDSKNLVTDYLDKWNKSGSITLYEGTADEITLAADERGDVNYTDALELVINLINGMIDVVSAALIAFTSISLVVSTVMIGIITYVSVVERVKEIGVIRSLGGRKKDVSRLFTAETFIIGLLAGLIGVGVTVGVSAIASAIIFELFGIPNIAALEPVHAILMVLLSIALTLFSGVMPARSAAKKDPVVALRTE